MPNGEEFSMSDKQTYDMIEKLSDKIDAKFDTMTENVNSIRQEVRQYNHVKDEVEKIHIKMDEHADQINKNSKTISDIKKVDKGEEQYKDKIMQAITFLSLTVGILALVGVI